MRTIETQNFPIMHIPDGFISMSVSIDTALVSVAGLALSLNGHCWSKRMEGVNPIRFG